MSTAGARGRLARQIAARAQKEADRVRYGHQLADIVKVKPLTLELHDQDGLLVEEDDFTVTQWFATYRRARGLQPGDNVILANHSGNLVATDVIADGMVAMKVKKIHEGAGKPPKPKGGGGEESEKEEEPEEEEPESEEEEEVEGEGADPEDASAKLLKEFGLCMNTGGPRREEFAHSLYAQLTRPTDAQIDDLWVKAS